MAKIKNLLKIGKKYLKNQNIDSYSLDAQILLSHITKLNRVDLILKSDTNVTNNLIYEYKKLLRRRSYHEPIEYITNSCKFMDLEFYVNKNVLIPRPETELLVEKCIKIIKQNNFDNILEIGTGSGCISICLAYYLGKISITSLDIDKKCLHIAYYNCIKNNITPKINFIQSNIFSNINNKKFDIIISNPPYIRNDEINKLEKNVKEFEPRLALDGGEDGLFFYKNIINNSRQFLNKDAYILFEVGFDQAQNVCKILEQNKYKNIEIIKDYSSFDRIVVAKS